MIFVHGSVSGRRETSFHCKLGFEEPVLEMSWCCRTCDCNTPAGFLYTVTSHMPHQACMKQPNLQKWSFMYLPMYLLFVTFDSLVVLDVEAALMPGKCQRADPSGWSRGRNCYFACCGGFDGGGLLPDREAACAEPRVSCIRSGPPPPANCWGDGRWPHWEGGSPAPRRSSEPAAAATAAQLSWRPEPPARREGGAGGASGGSCGITRKPYRGTHTDTQLSLLMLSL